MNRTAWIHGGVAVVIVVLGMAIPVGAEAQDTAAQSPQDSALGALVQILRDRSLITAEEYERIRVALAPPPALTPSPATGPSLTQAAPASAAAPPVRDVPQAVAAALEGKWYERISLRGYTQFRSSEVLAHRGEVVEVPADRSVNEAETLVIRRGRFIFSGDITRRLALYAQSDFNGSTVSGADYSLQMRDLYADIALNGEKSWRVRLGQSKVPFGFVNMQSSQNRLALERPDALNSAVEGERDYGAYLMWAPAPIRQRFRDLVSRGLKGSGDYGVVAVGAYSGQGLNRSDLNGEPHVVARVSYPFAMPGNQMMELGIQAYHGRFVSPTQAIMVNGTSLTPRIEAAGTTDQRVAATFVWYAQPFGVEAEWNAGRGPALSASATSIEAASLHGGYIQAQYRTPRTQMMLPFVRWQYYDGGRKFARNAPRSLVNEIDFGLEWAPWTEVELTGIYTHTLRRTRTSTYPFGLAEDGKRVAVQLQWNY